MYRNNKSIYITSLNVQVEPLQIPLVKGGEAFWLDTRTVAHVVEGEKANTLDLYALSVEIETQGAENALTNPHPPVLVGSFPTGSATNFVYNAASNQLVFSDDVYADGDLYKVNEQDEAWKFENRGTTALVYDETYERHWDHWILPKSAALFSVKLHKSGDKWELSKDFTNLLKGTDIVSIFYARLNAMCLDPYRYHPLSHLEGPITSPSHQNTSYLQPKIQNFVRHLVHTMRPSIDVSKARAWHTKQNVKP